uniref:Uncharacterized protein n=1 Tax=Arundo donax TaxID=35708 RepID=A0A0A9HBH8_ARUDO
MDFFPPVEILCVVVRLNHMAPPQEEQRRKKDYRGAAASLTKCLSASLVFSYGNSFFTVLLLLEGCDLLLVWTFFVLSVGG